ncbi:MAG: Asp-tRNA(Asn)/Glu-tRNA(Gln) amidotransferase subunit GatA [Sphingobacteriales bacterium]|nr:MAG: Asp-tRNA(Asn)/Glu-tRNA(Gln) amidotransferase subunit GatA [Sphingobacteriales bacterium]
MEIYRSLETLQRDVANRVYTCTQITKSYIKNIQDNDTYNAFLEVFEASALEQAKLIDDKIKNNQTLGKLFGLIIGIKDNIVYKNHKSSAASKILENYISPYSATVVERLLAEDAIIIGRLNCDEFAMGGSNENSAFGPVKNPIDITRVAGGSSGGSAAAVAAGLCIASLGSDTGGSIRQPAAFCGNIGFKPTYGRVSRWGLIAYASSFDQIGPITNNIDDAISIYEVIAGSDDFDATCSQKHIDISDINTLENKKYKIAYFGNAIHHNSIDVEVKQACIDIIDKLQNEGHTLVDVSLDELDYIVPAYYVLTTAEASSNLSRFDGVKYGFHAQEAKDLEETYTLSRAQGFGKEVQRRIMSGTFVLSAGYYDAYYAKAQKVRRIVSEKTFQIFKEYDFILCPTAPTTAYKIGAVQDTVASFLGDIFTVQANIVGIPAISLPLAKDKNNLPIGIQIMANKFDESKLLAFAKKMM